MLATDYILERKYRTSNIQRFDNNRKRLQTLIFSLGSFTEEEIFREFSKGGDTVIDTEQTVYDYLQQLVFSGLLHYEFGNFKVQ